MTDGPKPRLELYVRSLMPDGAGTRQDAIIERVEQLEADGAIQDYSVVVWGKQIAREAAGARTEEGQFILNRVAEFEQWALSNNVSLDSFSQPTTVGHDATGDTYHAMVLPVMGLAEYRAGELHHVAPCAEGDVVHAITDRLDQLERGEPTALERQPQATVLSD